MSAFRKYQKGPRRVRATRKTIGEHYLEYQASRRALHRRVIRPAPFKSAIVVRGKNGDERRIEFD